MENATELLIKENKIGAVGKVGAVILAGGLVYATIKSEIWMDILKVPCLLEDKRMTVRQACKILSLLGTTVNKMQENLNDEEKAAIHHAVIEEVLAEPNRMFRLNVKVM